jgi:hypothetical protein
VLHRHAERLAEYLVKKARYGYFRVRVYRRYPAKALGDSYTPPAMGAQIALAGLAGALGMLAALGAATAARAARPGRPPARWPRRAAQGLGATLAVFALTTLPLARRAGPRQPALAALVPALVFLRAWAQGLGILAGLATALLRPSPHQSEV